MKEQDVTEVEITDEMKKAALMEFDRLARTYGIDYSLSERHMGSIIRAALNGRKAKFV